MKQFAGFERAQKEGTVYLPLNQAPEALRQVKTQAEADAINAAGGRAKIVYNDAEKPETFVSMIEETVRDAGRIDVLVNNFGTSNPGKDLDFARTDPEVFMNTVQLNLRSVFLSSQAAAKHMAVHGEYTVVAAEVLAYSYFLTDDM